MLELPKELMPYRHLIGNYKINLLEVCSMNNLDQYTGELKALFGFVKYQKDRGKLLEFVRDHEEMFKSVSTETAYAIKVMAGAGEIDKYLTKENEKEAVDMCQALQEMMEESRAEGEMRKLISLICRKIQKGKTPEIIAEDLDEDLSVIVKIFESAKEFAPDYDCGQIYKHMAQAD